MKTPMDCTCFNWEPSPYSPHFTHLEPDGLLTEMETQDQLSRQHPPCHNLAPRLQSLFPSGVGSRHQPTWPLWKWFRCYLTNRLHYVTIDGYQSSTLPVTSGVPQGSILGPLLFLIYINDLPSCINYSHCLLFADDAKIFQIVTSFHDQLLLQIDLHEIEQWCSTWNLQLNPSKLHSI